MKTIMLPIVLFLAFLPAAFAAETDEALIRNSFATYWKAYTTGDYSKAGEHILPDELALTKKALLPVFLAAAKSEDTVSKKFAETYFGDIPENKRADISPAQSFVCLNQFIGANAPALFEVLKTTTITVDRIEIQDEKAVMHYQIDIAGTKENDTETWVKKDGKWWLRMKEDPRDTAKKLRLALKLDPQETPKPPATPPAGEP